MHRLHLAVKEANRPILYMAAEAQEMVVADLHHQTEAAAEDTLEMVQAADPHSLMELMDLPLTEDLVDLEAADLDQLQALALQEAVEDILAELVVKVDKVAQAEAAAEAL
jgi:hypothetical protein